jgi:hypothetical protein
MKTTTKIIAFFILAIILTGCFGVNRDFKEIRDNVIDIVGSRVKKNIEFGVGAAGLALAGSFIRFAEEDDLPADIISYLDAVQIGVYENYFPSPNKKMREFRDFCNKMSDLGWQFIVRSIDEENMSLVFVKNDLGDGINELLVITNDNNELVIATMEGELEEIVEVAIRNKEFGVVMVNN